MLAAGCTTVPAPVAAPGHGHRAVETAPARPPGAARAPFLTPLEAQILEEMNLARTDPRRYAGYVAELLPHFNGVLLRRPGRVAIETNEGARAVREAVRALRATRPVPPLVVSKGMSEGARDHVRDQGKSGHTGHAGRDGSTAADRVNRYGRWEVSVSENIAYGPPAARDVVIGLIVDDGIPDRGHRTVMFNPTSRVTGIACGKHPRFRQMCVITYAVTYVEGDGAPLARPGNGNRTRERSGHR